MLFKENYHYLVAGLPDILLDEGRHKSSLAFFKAEFQNNLQPEDWALLNILFLKYDNANLLNLLLKKKNTFDDLGTYSHDFLQEQIKEPDHRIASYLKNFILKFKSGELETSGASWENELENDFYNFLNTTKNEFLKSWFAYTMNLQNITTALACRNHNMPIENQLIGNNIITEKIRHSNAGDFGLLQEFPEVEKILHIWQNETIIEREKALDMLKWDWIDNALFFHYFTIERIIGFTLQLEMVERWIKLDEETGSKLFDQLLSNMNKGYEIPAEFGLLYNKRK